MGSLRAYLAVYVLGGLTFVPLLLLLAAATAYLTLPQVDIEQYRKEQKSPTLPEQSADDDESILKSESDELKEKFGRSHESDVAAGYFAVLRDYTPNGASKRPFERATTAAHEPATADSPSVYQSVYRSLFDRKTSPTIDPAKDNGKHAKKVNNIFYVVIRHGHLLLYDDAEQIEVRYVISLALHDVSISVGGGSIPEGELWSKRTAVCLARPPKTAKTSHDPESNLPFYFFSDNASEKEDFYVAIVANLERIPGSSTTIPIPQKYDVKHMINLVKRLHSSEEQLQTRWLNALIGRWFLGVYRTQESKMRVRKKIEKKLSRVKTPGFVTKLALDFIEIGDAAPLITNPRLKDMAIDGICCVEFDVHYTGNFKAGLAATARIDLGPRIKKREVDMLLSVVLKKFKGHCFLMIKPPPSNRFWYSFETKPEIDMTIEPIVSSRQITYGFILRAIENKIREAVTETLVMPYWDDIPFLDTEGKSFRGGIWEDASEPHDEKDPKPIQHAATAPEINETHDATFSEFLTTLQQTAEEDNHRADGTSATSEVFVRQSHSEVSSISSSEKIAELPRPATGEEDAEHVQKQPQSKSKRKPSSQSLHSPMINVDTPSTEDGASQDQATERAQSVETPRQVSGHSPPRPRSQASDDSRMAPPSFSATPQRRSHRDTDAASIISTESRSTIKSRNHRPVMDSLNSAAAAAKKWSLNVLNRKNEDGGDDDRPRRQSIGRRSSVRLAEAFSKSPAPALPSRPAPVEPPLPPRPVPPREIPPVPPPRPQPSTKNSPPIKRKPVPPPYMPAPPTPPPRTLPSGTPPSGTAASDSPLVAASDPPGATASDLPGTAASDHPGTAASDPPGTAASDPSGAAASDPPEAAASDFSGTAASNHPAAVASDPPQAAASDPSRRAASDSSGTAAPS